VGACVAGLVDVGLGLEVLDADVGDILCLLDLDKVCAVKERETIPQRPGRCASRPGIQSSLCPHW
jgi:hypothetical protein